LIDDSMRALVYDRYGDASVLRIGEIPQPALAKGDVLVRVSRAALNPKDAIFRRGKFRRMSGRTFPKRCGCDVAGVVAETRSPHFRSGQRVFGCLQEWTFSRGTLADLVVCRDHEIALLPEAVSFEDGAAIALAGLTALQALRDVAILKRGQRVLINGASGGVGTPAIQLANIFGAEVNTLSSAENKPFCADLGAQHAWSYSDDAWKGAAPFDVVFDVFGNMKFENVESLMSARSSFVSTVPSIGRLVRDWLTRLSRKRERLVVIRPRRADLTILGELLVERKLRAVIDSRFSLAEFREAFARLESKRARGKIVIAVDDR
jgi:NADPH2:quinone reductase